MATTSYVFYLLKRKKNENWGNISTKQAPKKDLFYLFGIDWVMHKHVSVFNRNLLLYQLLRDFFSIFSCPELLLVVYSHWIAPNNIDVKGIINSMWKGGRVWEMNVCIDDFLRMRRRVGLFGQYMYNAMWTRAKEKNSQARSKILSRIFIVNFKSIHPTWLTKYLSNICVEGYRYKMQEHVATIGMTLHRDIYSLCKQSIIGICESIR